MHFFFFLQTLRWRTVSGPRNGGGTVRPLASRTVIPAAWKQSAPAARRAFITRANDGQYLEQADDQVPVRTLAERQHGYGRRGGRPPRIPQCGLRRRATRHGAKGRCAGLETRVRDGYRRSFECRRSLSRSLLSSSAVLGEKITSGRRAKRDGSGSTVFFSIFPGARATRYRDGRRARGCVDVRPAAGTLTAGVVVGHFLLAVGGAARMCSPACAGTRYHRVAGARDLSRSR